MRLQKGFPEEVMYEPRSGVSQEAPGKGGMVGEEEDSLVGGFVQRPFPETNSSQPRCSLVRALKSTDACVPFSAVLMELVWSVAWASGPLQVKVRTTTLVGLPPFRE